MVLNKLLDTAGKKKDCPQKKFPIRYPPPYK